MADLIWKKYVIRGTRTPNPRFAGRVIAGLEVEMWGDDTVEPENRGLLEYRRFKTEDVPVLDAKLADAGRHLAKFGFTQTGSLELTAVNIADGLTRKAHKLLKDGIGELIEFGDERAVKKGRSSHKDWDDETGKPNKHGK